MFIKGKTTILDKIFYTESNNFRSQYKKGSKIITSSHITDPEIHQQGNVIYPIDAALKSVSDLMTYRSFCTKDNNPEAHCYEDLFSSVTSTILTLEGKYTFEEAINKIIPFINKAGCNFYGALLRNGNTIINPFSVAAIMSHLRASYTDKYNIILYFYKNRSKLDVIYKTNESDPETVGLMIENIIKPIAAPVVYTSLITDVEERHDNTVYITEAKRVHIDSLDGTSSLMSEHYLVAHQAITRGVIAPYYGASVLAKESISNAVGVPITPMLSANISASHILYEGKLKGDKDSTVPFGPVCTGTEPSSTIKGLTSLTQCNMLSPYNRSIIVSGALAYVDASINKCLEIYKRIMYIHEYVPIVTPITNSNPFPEEAINAYFNNDIATYISSRDLPLEYFNEIEQYITKNNIRKQD